MKRKWLRVTLVVIVVLAGVYVLGPSPATPVYAPGLPPVPTNTAALQQYVQVRESHHRIKPENEACIVWQDSLHRKTPYSIVYLHGFSASRKEGDPVAPDIARRYGCNLFLSRLDGHGIDTSEPLLTMTAEGLWRDAKEALAIGHSLGQRVIIMSTSTGGTLALKLAAEFPNEVYAIVNMSPNIAINDPLAFLANNPWGLQVARYVKKGLYNRSSDNDPVRGRYWNNAYRLEAVIQLENLLESTMTKATFQKVHQPILNLYYYKDEAHQDPTVRVSAILEMEKELGTPAAQKAAIAIAGAGAHVLGSSLVSKDVPGVERAIDDFMTRILKLKPL
ncbi:alpha/beta hydrolase [Chitinophaga agrisoli]|uniref:Alpha/beta hydrolase n=1 Tax=Chitinophaga agrisoli TaxID=2607653 RepID=A0A5B2VTD7_9BACT|nr:alpha/beta fold hydrolase [Chitinophaga agrisoli]KAA2243063.1 alpha/beta hydrolase [Chitinophaga agrisoli]